MSILKVRNRQPIISFGLGVTEVTTTLGKIIPINQTEVYNSSSVVSIETDLINVKFNNNYFEVECNILGTHEIRANLNGLILSNKVIINVTT